MRSITRDEIVSSMDHIEERSFEELEDMVFSMQEKQPYLQAYVAAICESGAFDDEDDRDIFVHLSLIIWHAMYKAQDGAFAQVTGDDIDEMEEKSDAMISYASDAEGDEISNMLQAWLDGCNQRPLIEFTLDALMNPKSPYAATEEGVGVIFPSLKVVIDCLDNAASVDTKNSS